MGVIILCKMNKSLAERKTDIVRYLHEEYAEQPGKWWQERKPVYTATEDMGNLHLPQPFSSATITRYDLKGALISSALFFMFYVLCFLIPASKETDTGSGFWIYNAFIVGVLFYSAVRVMDRRPKIVFNQDGFWIDKMELLMPWNYLAASFIKKDDNGETTSYYLVLHYYDDKTDQFVKTDINLGGLEMNFEEIAFNLEYWKLKTTLPAKQVLQE